jgi:uncharacterized protein (UPF0335 family)
MQRDLETLIYRIEELEVEKDRVIKEREQFVSQME